MRGEDGERGLGVLETTRFVVISSDLVKMNEERIKAVASQIAGQFELPPWNTRYHFFDGTERTVNYVLLLDALNFSFWGEPRWRLDYHGEKLDGYWALAAALKRAIEESIPVYDAAYLANLQSGELAQILRGEGEVPLFRERLANAREVGLVLLDRYEGKFAKLVETCQGSAVQLACRLAAEFSSFRDVAVYKGHEVRFLKRAQICAVDLYGAFGGQAWGRFVDLDQLTVFADYKLPQVLRALGALVYAPALAETVDRMELIPAGSPAEIEIRANTVWAAERLKEALRNEGVIASAFEIDWWLWQKGQEPLPDIRPYHRTRTIYY